MNFNKNILTYRLYRHFSTPLIVLFALIINFAASEAVWAGSIDNEKTNFGSACSGTKNGADWDTIFQCSSSTWNRSAYFLGSSPDSCDSNHAGMIRWDGAAVRGCNGSNWLFFTNGYSGGVTVTNYTASGTWTPQTNSTLVDVLCVGGGSGGGGGSQAFNSGGQYTDNSAFGGESGSSAESIFVISSLTTPVTITIGAGGAGAVGAGGGVGASQFGSPGGNTTFGTYLEAYGGAANNTSTSPLGAGYTAPVPSGADNAIYPNYTYYYYVNAYVDSGPPCSDAPLTSGNAPYVSSYYTGTGGAGGTLSNYATASTACFSGGGVAAGSLFGGSGGAAGTTTASVLSLCTGAATNGGNGNNSTNPYAGTGGGGGGASCNNGGNGGNGGYGSGGGAGGNCSSCTASSGKGGNGGSGGSGFCVIKEW